eukprot:146529-Hanusia_phi.AAC.3
MREHGKRKGKQAGQYRKAAAASSGSSCVLSRIRLGNRERTGREGAEGRKRRKGSYPAGKTDVDSTTLLEKQLL